MAKIVYWSGGEGEYLLCAGKPNFFIGRHSENDLAVDHRGVSRFHAAIFNHGTDYWLISYGPNGTFYNREETSFLTEHFVEDIKLSKAYCQLKDIVEPEIAAAAVAEMSGAAVELMKKQSDVMQTMGPGVVMPRAQVRDIDIIRKIVGNSLRAKVLSGAAKKLENGGYIAMPAVRDMGNLKVFRVLF